MLRRQPLRDTQDLLVLFTPGGRVDCVVRGALRRSALCEPLTVLEVQLYRGRSLPQLQEATLTRTYSGVVSDLYLLGCAGYLIQLWLEAFPGDTDGSAPFRLLLIALEGLEQQVDAPWVLSWVEYQVLRLAGLGPETRRCVGCGSEAVTRFAVESGGVLCSSCPGSGARSLSPAALAWLRSLRSSPLLVVATAHPPVAAADLVARLLRLCVLRAYPGLARFQPERWKEDENSGD